MVRPVQLPDRHRFHPAAVAGERVADGVAGGRIPHSHRLVVAAGDHDGAPVQLPDRHRIHLAWCGR